MIGQYVNMKWSPSEEDFFLFQFLTSWENVSAKFVDQICLSFHADKCVCHSILVSPQVF